MKRDISTRLVSVARPHGQGPAGAVPVNPPVSRASTFIFDTLADFETASKTPFDLPFYGRVGTPTTFAFEEAMAEMEGGARSIATSSGLAAISATFLAFLQAGDHVLVVDSVYDPVRRFCNRTLSRMGVETTFYDPATGEDIRDLVRPETKLIYMESPGSGTLDVQDVRSIVSVAKAAGIRTAIDNTWATPLFFRPLEHGIDVSIHAATKYIVGHSDAMLGVVTTHAECYNALRRATQDMGCAAGTEECNLGLRGLRTLELRLGRHQASALELARWLATQPGIAGVLHPAIETSPGHIFWKRDFDGAAGLFTIGLESQEPETRRRFIDALKLFHIGFSWGGYESLVLPVNLSSRISARWSDYGPLVRLQIGLEAVEDLRADLANALAIARG